MAILVPNTASIFTVSASFAPASPARWTWVGLATAGASGSVMWFAGASGAGSPFQVIIASPLETKMFGPFVSDYGWAAASISGAGASAIIQQKL